MVKNQKSPRRDGMQAHQPRRESDHFAVQAYQLPVVQPKASVLLSTMPEL